MHEFVWPNHLWFMILTSRTELFVNFKRVELEPRKWFVSNSSRVSSRINSYRVESSSDKFDL